MRPRFLPARLPGMLLVVSLAACGTFGIGAQQPHIIVFFQAFSADLDASAKKSIGLAADWAKQHPGAPLLVIGYASSDGTAQGNKDLSRLRAEIVSDTLIADGIAPARIHRRALGAVDYRLDPQETRRVEIALGEQ
jgi:outer membrane protein OmpA-like peptidoglycan-associated protein